MIKIQINLIWGQPFDILPDSKTVFFVAELTVDDHQSENMIITWNKSLGMIHLLDEESSSYIKIRGDQERI